MLIISLVTNHKSKQMEVFHKESNLAPILFSVFTFKFTYFRKVNSLFLGFLDLLFFVSLVDSTPWKENQKPARGRSSAMNE